MLLWKLVTHILKIPSKQSIILPHPRIQRHINAKLKQLGTRSYLKQKRKRKKKGYGVLKRQSERHRPDLEMNSEDNHFQLRLCVLWLWARTPSVMWRFPADVK